MTLTDDALAARIAGSLPAARWFSGKGGASGRVTIHERLPIPGAAGFAIVLAEVHGPSGGEGDRYVLPVDAAGADAAIAPECVAWLLDTMLSGRQVAGRAGRFTGHAVAGEPSAAVGLSAVTAATAARKDLVVVPIGGDASNTSLVVSSGGKSRLVKLVRRCRPGLHPEVEVGMFFALNSPWADTPRLRGWLDHDGRVIATVHDFLPGCTSAWDRLCGLLGDPASGACIENLVATLGRTTGRMHAALAARPDLPAFAAEAPSASSRSSMAGRLAAHANDVFERIGSAAVPPQLANRLAALAEAGPLLVGRLGRAAALAPDAADIRVHGDYHLGQVLVDGEGRAFVIDFEGEPARPLDERRAKTRAAKDVAGMCRSLDYALRHVARSMGRPYHADELARLEAVFLQAYESVATGQAWWPVDRVEALALIEVFKLDKALYELAYELDNRPDWAEVPLAALELAAIEQTGGIMPGRSPG
jgi:maltose alpha-D-glucosyltransferase/alpha-amylase